MTLEVYVDESGRADQVPPYAKRKQALFVLAGIVVDDKRYERLREEYEALLDVRVKGGSGDFTLRELFEIYARVTGRRPEVKAGWLVNCEGPFSVLRHAPSDVRRHVALTILEHMLRAAVYNALKIYIVVVDKSLAHSQAQRVKEASGLDLNLRAFALDFLVTRLAGLGDPNDEITIVHDYVSEAQMLREYFSLAAERGYIYNPKLRRDPDLYRRMSIVFRRSEDEPLLQYADVVAYAARSLKSGVSNETEEHIYRSLLYIHPSGRVEWVEYTRGLRTHRPSG